MNRIRMNDCETAREVVLSNGTADLPVPNPFRTNLGRAARFLEREPGPSSSRLDRYPVVGYEQQPFELATDPGPASRCAARIPPTLILHRAISNTDGSDARSARVRRALLTDTIRTVKSSPTSMSNLRDLINVRLLARLASYGSSCREYCIAQEPGARQPAHARERDAGRNRHILAGGRTRRRVGRNGDRRP